jgi:hypothetical protein
MTVIAELNVTGTDEFDWESSHKSVIVYKEDLRALFSNSMVFSITLDESIRWEKSSIVELGAAFRHLGLFPPFNRRSRSVAISKSKLLIQNLTLMIAASARLSIRPEKIPFENYYRGHSRKARLRADIRPWRQSFFSCVTSAAPSSG